MDSLNYESEKLAQFEGAPTSSEEFSSPRHLSSSEARELVELKQILQSNLTPNKRSIIEALIYSWEARFAAKSTRDVGVSIASIDKKKSKVNTVSVSYPG